MPRYIPAKAKEAAARGEKFYFSTPCKHGHAPLRYSSTGTCVACQKRLSQNWSKKNPKQFYEIQLKYIQKKLSLDPNNKHFQGFKKLAIKKIAEN